MTEINYTKCEICSQDGYLDFVNGDYEDMTLEEHHFISCVCGFCGCGDNTAVLKDIRKYLSMIQDEKTAEIPELILKFLDKTRTIEHGGSVWGSWLTDYGIKILIDKKE